MAFKNLHVLSVCSVLLGVAIACGGSQTSGFSTNDGGGPDATVGGGDGGSHHGDKDSGSIHLTGDASSEAGESGACTGLACNVASCGGGGDTTVSGVVYAPNGTLPLYDVQVFIPNAPLGTFPKGVQCDHCGAQVSGEPITTALSDPTGHFTLTGVPSGANIPIVVQLGKWRREATIPMVASCSANTLTDPNLTRLPKNQTEGSMPHIALTTGGCDNLGCMLPKVGIDLAEFGYESDGYNKAINIYNGDESVLSVWGAYTPLPATPAMDLWGSSALISTYDMAIFSCECSEAASSKGTSGSPPFGIVSDYLNAGGRIFTTDFQYTWYKFSPDPGIQALGVIPGGAPSGGNPIQLDTSFPKGMALATWLQTVFPTDMYASMDEVYPDYVFSNIQSLASSAVTWASSPSPTGPRVFTVDTPVGKPSAAQCGRGVHIDAHVDQPGSTSGDSVACSGSSCYPATCTAPLKPDEAMFAFFFFDLASCVEDDMKPPAPPPPAPK